MIDVSFHLTTYEVRVVVIHTEQLSWVVLTSKTPNNDGATFYCDSAESAMQLGEAFILAAPKSSLEVRDHRTAQKSVAEGSTD